MPLPYQNEQGNQLVLSELVKAKVTNPKGIVVMLQNIDMFGSS